MNCELLPDYCIWICFFGCLCTIVGTGQRPVYSVEWRHFVIRSSLNFWRNKALDAASSRLDCNTEYSIKMTFLEYFYQQWLNITVTGWLISICHLPATFSNGWVFSFSPRLLSSYKIKHMQFQNMFVIISLSLSWVLLKSYRLQSLLYCTFIVNDFIQFSLFSIFMLWHV